jgi:hypothetical protein
MAISEHGLVLRSPLDCYNYNNKDGDYYGHHHYFADKESIGVKPILKRAVHGFLPPPEL